MIISLRVSYNKNNYSLRDFLRSEGISANVIKNVKYTTGFCVNGLTAHTNIKLNENDIVTFNIPQDKASAVVAEALPLCISYESDFAMVINKSAGVAVHPTLNYSSGTLANGYAYLMQQRGETRAFRPINRLDVNTSGLVMCAQNMLSADFLANGCAKTYYAIVQKELPMGIFTINAPIALAQNTIIKRCVSETGKLSVTTYETLCAKNGHSLVRVQPLTGRTHQIRVHFASIGAPLAGDDLYGGNINIIKRHALHCYKMEFTEPFCQNKNKATAKLPEDMISALLQLNFQYSIE